MSDDPVYLSALFKVRGQGLRIRRESTGLSLARLAGALGRPIADLAAVECGSVDVTSEPDSAIVTAMSFALDDLRDVIASATARAHLDAVLDWLKKRDVTS